MRYDLILNLLALHVYRFSESEEKNESTIQQKEKKNHDETSIERNKITTIPNITIFVVKV